MKRLLCLAFAALIWLTLLLRLGIVLLEALDAGQRPLLAVVCSFQYFTLTTTLLAAIAVTATVWRSGSHLAGPGFAGMVCTSILLVALVYTLMLRELWEPQGLRKLVDVLLHDVIPPLFFIFWLWFSSTRKLPWHTLLLWLVYPVLYLAAILFLGNLQGSYPYPFLQVGELGFQQVLLNSLELLLFYAVLGALLLGLSRGVLQYTSRR